MLRPWKIHPLRVRRVTLLAFACSLVLALGGCGGDDDGGGEGNRNAGRGEGTAGRGEGTGGRTGRDAGPDETDDGGADSGGAQCTPTGAREHPHDSQPAAHVSEPLPPGHYNSDPPSSGEHCSDWGRYDVYGPSAPLPACNYLHNLEHGAVVLLYNCPDGCPEIVEKLEQLIADAPDDPDCGAAKRLILTPYEEMEPTVAAAAWGYTWTSDCLDGAAAEDLLEFITEHWGSRGDAPEATLCAPGRIGP